MKVTKAIITAAGLGTRVLPATKAMPKEMLPIVDKPAIQLLVEEAVASGITEILIIINRGKSLIEDHFDYAPELELALQKSGKTEMLQQVRSIAELCNITFIRQKETKGLGHAVLAAESFAAGEPIVVIYGDDVIIGEPPTTKQLIDAFEKYGKPAVAMNKVSKEQLTKYSSLKVTHIEGRCYSVCDMIEKPKPGDEFSQFSILGRCLLTADIFEILKKTPPGAGGEIQLTDAMAVVARATGITGVDFIGRRYDMGSKLGILEAQVEQALANKELSEDFKRYLKTLNI